MSQVLPVRGSTGAPVNKLDPATGLQGSQKTPVFPTRGDQNIYQMATNDPSSLGGGEIMTGRQGDPLDPSKFDFRVKVGADNEELRAQDQSVIEQSLYGAGRLVGTTATKFLEGFGYMYGIGEALASDIVGTHVTLGDALDNAWTNFWGNADQSVKDALPIYHTNKYNQGNIFKQMATWGFWMDDVVDGLAFLASAAIGSKGISAVGKATGVYGKIANAYAKSTVAARTGNVSQTAGLALKNIGNEAELISMTVGNSAIEAGFEAKDTMDELIKQGVSREDAARAAQGTFIWNMGILMVPNYITNSMLFGKANPLHGRIKNVIGADGKLVSEVTPLTKAQKIGAFAKAGGTSMASEGAWEENIQLAIQDYWKGRAEGKEERSQFEGMFRNWANNWTTDEGQKSIALGAIIGLIPGGMGGVREAKADKANEIQLHTILGTTINSINKEIEKQDLYLKDKDKNIIKDEKGQPMIDPMKIAFAFMHTVGTNENWLKTVDAISTGNDIMFDRLDEERIASLALAYVSNPDGLYAYDAQVDNLARQKVESSLNKGEPVDEAKVKELARKYKEKGRLFKTLYDNVDQMYAGMYDFYKPVGDKVTDALLFSLANKVMSNAMATQYMGAVDQIFWNDKLEEIDSEISKQKSQTKGALLGDGRIEELAEQRIAVEGQIEESRKIVKRTLSKDYWQKEYDEASAAVIEEQKKIRNAAPVVPGTETKPVEPKVTSTNPATGTPQVDGTVSSPEETVYEEVLAREEEIVASEDAEVLRKARKESVVHELTNRKPTEVTGAETEKPLAELEAELKGGIITQKEFNEKTEELFRLSTGQELADRYGDPVLGNMTFAQIFSQPLEGGAFEATYSNQHGTVFIDQETNEIVFKATETGKEYIIGKTTDEELFNGELRVADLGVIPLKHTEYDIELDTDGVGIIIQGRRYILDIDNPTQAIEEIDGEIHVTLKDVNGVPITFTSQVLATELAYTIELLEEAREVAYQQFLDDQALQSDFAVVTIEGENYNVYKLPDGSYEIVQVSKELEHAKVAGQKKALLVVNVGTFYEGFAKVPAILKNGKANPKYNKILRAYLSDLGSIIDRVAAEYINAGQRATEEERTALKNKVRDEITEFVKYSRAATAKEIIAAPSTRQVSDTKAKQNEKAGQQKVAETTAGAKKSSAAGTESSTGQSATGTNVAGSEDADVQKEVTVTKKKPGRPKKKQSAEEQEIVDEKAEEKVNEPPLNKPVPPEEGAEEFEPIDTEVDVPGIKSPAGHSTPHPETGAAQNMEDSPDVDTWLSNPANKVEDLTAVAEIDYESTDPDWKRGSKDLASIKENVEKYGTEVFDKAGKEFRDPVDTISIKITFYGKDGKEVKELRGFYIHKSDFANVESIAETEEQKIMWRNGQLTQYDASRDKMVQKARVATRTERRAILKDIIAGKKVVLTGWEKSPGTLSQTKGQNRKVGEAFDVKQGFATIADGQGTLWDGKGSWIAGRGHAGNFFWTTTETANGDQRSMKLNNAKLTEESARILLRAYRQLITNGGKAIYLDEEGKQTGTDPLTVIEVINYLVHDGEITDMSGQGAPTYLRVKTLYLKDFILHYGTNTLDLHKDPSKKQIEDFVAHITANKNYNTPLQTATRTGTGIGTVLTKDFRIGSIVGHKDDTYEQFLFSNGMVLTDAIKDPVTGRVFSKPMLWHAPYHQPKPAPIVEEEEDEVPEEKPKGKKKDTPKKDTKKATKKQEEKAAAVTGTPQPQTYFQIVKGTDFSEVPRGTDIFFVSTMGNEDNESESTGNIYVIGYITADENGNNIFKMSPKIKSKETSFLIEDVKRYDGLSVTDPKLLGLLNIGSYTLHAEMFMPGNKGVKSDEGIIESNDLDETPFVEDDDTPPFAHKAPKGQPYTKGDINKAIATLRKKLGPAFTIKIEEDLIRILEEGKTTMAFGTFQRDAITLSKRLAKGTEYEEAFHRVSLLYLTPAQQKAIYDEGRKKYNMKDATDRQINEKLATEYREMETRGEKISPPTTVTGKIKQFFIDLFDFIATVFTNRLHISNLDIKNLFRVMGKSDGKLGRLYHSKPIPSSYALLKRGDVYTHTVKGKQLTHVKNTAQLTQIVNHLVWVMVNKSNITKTKDIDSLRYMSALGPMKKRVADNMHNAKVSQGKGDLKAAEHYEDLAGFFQEIVDNYDIYLDLMKSQIEALGIRTILPENPEDESDMRGNNFQRYNKASFELAGRDNAQGAIKLTIATLQASNEKDGDTDLYKFVDYDSVFNDLVNTLSEMYTVEEMVEYLKSSNSFPYQMLAKKLEQDRESDPFDTLHTQFGQAMNKNRYNFINALSDLKAGRAGIEVADAETQKIAYARTLVWGQAFLLSEAFQGGKPNKAYLTKIIKDYSTLVNQVKRESFNKNNHGKLPSYKQFFKEVIRIFNSVSVPMDEDVLNNILDGIVKGDRHAALLEFLIATKMSPVFGDKGAFATLRDDNKVKGKKGVELELDHLFRNEEIFKETIATAYNNIHGKLTVTTILGPDGNPYYLYSEQSYITDLLHALRVNPPKGLNLATLSQQADNGSRLHSFLLKQLQKPSVRENIDVITFSALSIKNNADKGRAYSDISDVEDSMVKIALFESGYILLPQLGDRGHLYGLKGLKPIDFNYLVGPKGELIIPEDIVNLFYGYAQDEYNHIVQTQKDIDEAKKNGTEDQLVEFNHFDPKIGRNDKGYAAAQGLKYHHITEFNGKGYNLNDTKKMPLYKGMIRKMLQANINDALELLNKQGIIGFAPGGLVFNKMFNAGSIQAEAKSKYAGNIDITLRNKIASFQLNQIMATIESEKLIFMSPAYYKDLDDKIKRYTATASTGSVSRMSFPEQVMPGDRLLHNNDQFTFSVLATQKLNLVELIDKLKPKFIASFMARGYSEEAATDKARQVLEGYTKVDPTDGQTYITPHMFRALHIRLGEWTPAKEEAYKLVIQRRQLDVNEQRIVDELFMQPLKFAYYGPQLSPTTARPIMIKTSLATLTWSLVEGTQLQSLYDTMMDEGNPIDMVPFDSSVKTGVVGKTAYFTTDENGQPDNNLVNELDLLNVPKTTASFQFLRRQQVTDPHNELRDVVKTQFRKVSLSNISDTRIYHVGDEQRTGKELKEDNVTYMGELSDRGVSEFLDQLGVDSTTMLRTDPVKLFTILRTRARMSGMPDALIDALAEQFDQERFELDALPDRKWLQSTLVSMLGKASVDLKLPGTALIQMANFGLHTAEKNSELKLIDDEGYMEALISVEVFRDVIPNYNDLTHSERLEFINAMFVGVGYRVPTQGLVSTVPLKIKGFLPATSTATIALPSAFTTLTGSDFDIDKLYFIRNNYDVVKGKPVKVKYLTEKNSDELQRLQAFSYEAIEAKAKMMKKALAVALSDMYGDLAFAKAEIAKLKSGTDSTMTDEADIDTKSPEYLEELAYQRKLSRDNLYKEKAEIYKQITEQREELEKRIEKERLDWMDKHMQEFIDRPMLKQNTKKAIENRLIDSYFAVLLANDHIVDNWMPLDATTSLLKGLSTKILELEGKTRDYPSFYTASHNYQQEVKHKYIWGKKGIGPFARANVHHILGQIAGIHLGDYIGVGNTVEIDGEIVTDLSQMYGTDKESILDWLSALINAHVDISKDAYIFELNVNDATYGVGELLVRAGVGEQTFEFLAQPILKEYALAASNYKGKIKPVNMKPLTQMRYKYQKALDAARVKEKIRDKVVSTDEIFDSKRLLRDIDDNTPHDSNYYARQLQILAKFSSLNEYGTYLFEAVEATQIDTKGWGKNVSELRRFHKLVNKVMTDNVIKNMDKLFDMTYVGKYFQNSVILGQRLFKDTSVMYSDCINALSDRIMEEIGKGDDVSANGLRMMNYVNDEIFAAIAGRFFVNDMGYGEARVQDMLFGDNSMVARLSRIMADATYAENQLIKTLQPWMSFKDDVPDHIMLFTATETRTKWNKDRLIESWEELLQSTNPEVRSFAEDLVAYSFFTSGFKKNMHSIYHFIPPMYLKQIGYSKYLKNMRNEFNDINNYGLTNSIHDDVFQNLWQEDEFVPEVAHAAITQQRKPGEDAGWGEKYPFEIALDVYSSFNRKPPLIETLGIGYNKFDNVVFKPFIKIHVSGTIQLYKYIGNITNREGDIEPVYIIQQAKGFSESTRVVKEHGLNKSVIPGNASKDIPGGTKFKAQTFTENVPGKKKLVADFSTFVEATPEDMVVVSKIIERPDEGVDLESDEILQDYSQRTGEVMGTPTEDETITPSTIKFTKSAKTGYPTRTVENAQKDVTIAFAINFDSAGEKLTKRAVTEAKKIYLPIPVPKGPLTAKRRADLETVATGKHDFLDALLDKVEKAGLREKGITLNIAGNSMHTLSQNGYSQKDAHDMVKAFLQGMINHGIKIKSITTGGQTGFDEAGATAASELGIPVEVHAPADWRFRGSDAVDINDEKKFKARFVKAESKPTAIEGVSEDQLKETNEDYLHCDIK